LEVWCGGSLLLTAGVKANFDVEKGELAILIPDAAAAVCEDKVRKSRREEDASRNKNLSSLSNRIHGICDGNQRMTTA